MQNRGVSRGIGNGTFTLESTLFTGDGSQPVFVGAADLNSDSQLDIIVVNSVTGTVGIFLGQGNLAFSEQTTLSTGDHSDPFYAVIRDFNQDSRLDIVTANSRTSAIGIFLGLSNGTFSSQTTISTGTGSQPYVLEVADFNHDNVLDIVVANYGANVGLLIGNGDRTFQPMIAFSIHSGSRDSIFFTLVI